MFLYRRHQTPLVLPCFYRGDINNYWLCFVFIKAASTPLSFVKFFGSIEGLVHISQLPNKKIDNIVEKAFQNGNEIKVKLLSINRGRYSLSMIAIK